MTWRETDEAQAQLEAEGATVLWPDDLRVLERHLDILEGLCEKHDLDNGLDALWEIRAKLGLN